MAAAGADGVEAAFELADAALRIDSGRLRQLGYADEVVRVKCGEAVDQFVRYLRPFEAQAFVADMVRHVGCARREDRKAGAALALELELRAFDARTQFVIADIQGGPRRLLLGVFDGGNLVLAKVMQLLRLRGVVTVAVDDHGAALIVQMMPARPPAVARMVGRAMRLSNGLTLILLRTAVEEQASMILVAVIARLDRAIQ